MKRSQLNPCRVGVIGFAHMHVNELVDRFVQCGRARIVACADTQPRTPSRTRVEGSRHANLMRALAAPGEPRAYRDYREMLDKEELDIVIMCPENARHGEVAEAAASHGAHILTEKPMAARLDEARRMAAAARKAGVTLAVNWPVTWLPQFRRLKELVEAGAIGEVWELKWRNGASLGPLAHGSLHPGSTTIGLVSDDEKAANGGTKRRRAAALFSTTAVMGRVWRPGSFPSRRSRFNASRRICAVAMATPRTTRRCWSAFPQRWRFSKRVGRRSTAGFPNGPILFGSEGTIVVDGDDILVYRDRGSKAPTLIEKGSPAPEGRSNIAEEFLHHLETGEPMHPTLEPPMNLATMAILDAGIKSAETGAATPVAQASAEEGEAP